MLGGMAAAVDGVVARDVDNKANQTSNFWIPTVHLAYNARTHRRVAAALRGGGVLWPGGGRGVGDAALRVQNTPEAAPKEVTKPSNETMCPEGCHALKLKCAAQPSLCSAADRPSLVRWHRNGLSHTQCGTVVTA